MAEGPLAPSRIADFVHGLGVDAYLVGGGVRDELLGKAHKDQDFVVPAVGYDELRRVLEPHGRVEDLEVAGQRVGLRLYPRDRELREVAPAGIEFAPPRRERSTGPGRHDFEIVAAADIPLEDDLRRRDFTVNAIAKRLATGELLDPFGGREDLRKKVLRTVSPDSFREDPLRLVRGLRFVSELDLDPDEETVRQMREEAPSVALVSGERIGGGLTADGLGELSRLLLGARPAKALRLARDTSVLTHLLPEYAPAIGHEVANDRQHLTLDEHHFAVVQAAADHGAPLSVRLAALLHDLGKARAPGHDHTEAGSAIAADVLERLRYPTRLRERVVRIVRHHDEPLDDTSPAAVRGYLARFGDELMLDLAAHKLADVAGKTVPEQEQRLVAELCTELERQLASPHRLSDLVVGGDDLKELGYSEGPELGRALRRLLDLVVEDPSSNTRERLLEAAKALR